MRQSRIATLLHGKDTMKNINYAHFIYERTMAAAAKIYQQRGWVDASVIGIDFGAMDVGASQEAACGVDVATSGEGHRGEGVTQAVLSRQLQYDWVSTSSSLQKANGPRCRWYELHYLPQGTTLQL